MPESIGMLTLQQAFAHQDEVLLQGFVFLALGREVVHTANQGCIDPSVATTPIAVVAILLLVGRHIVLVAPPESFFHIEAATTEGVARPVVTLHGVVEILLIVSDGIHLYIYGHGHLDGINPCPVVDAVGTYLIVQILTGQVQRPLTRELMVFDVRLFATLVVCIRGLNTPTSHPLVMVNPALGIVEVALIWVDAIKRHQSFVIDGTRPEVALAHSFDKGGNGRVAILCHEVVVGLLGSLQDFLLGLGCRKSAAYET